MYTQVIASCRLFVCRVWRGVGGKGSRGRLVFSSVPSLQRESPACDRGEQRRAEEKSRGDGMKTPDGGKGGGRGGDQVCGRAASSEAPSAPCLFQRVMPVYPEPFDLL